MALAMARQAGRNVRGSAEDVRTGGVFSDRGGTEVPSHPHKTEGNLRPDDDDNDEVDESAWEHARSNVQGSTPLAGLDVADTSRIRKDVNVGDVSSDTGVV